MKKLAIALLVLVAVAGGAAYWLRGNMDGLIKDAIVKYGSEMTGARVEVAAVNIQPADGRGVIRGLTVGNPAGFKTGHALKVGEIEVALDLASLAGDVITVKKIGIAAPDVIYEKGEHMTNFDAIQKNVAAYVGPSEKKETKGSGKKLIVEELAVRNAHAQAAAAFMNGKTVALPLPDIHLRDLGKAKGGVTPGELGQEIVGALKAKLAAAVSFDNLMKSAGQKLEAVGDAAKEKAAAAKEKAGELKDKAGAKLKGLFGK